jgi:general secretion pathway protein I
MTLAESVLAANALIPPEGVNAQGNAQGYAWQVRTAPFSTAVSSSSPQAPKLHEIEVQVRWSDGSREREFALKSLRPERIVLPAAELNR